MSEALVEKKLEQWRYRPDLFVQEAIIWPPGQGPSTQQLDALRLVGLMARAKIKKFQNKPLDKDEKIVAGKLGITIRSGHGTGKDAWLAWVYLWLLTCFAFPKGLVTAPTSHQLRDVLWGEINKWIRQSPLISSHLEWQTEKIFAKGQKEEWFVTARTANLKGTEEEQGEALAGLHAEYMILAVDEASGVPAGVFKPIEGALTGMMNFAILIGNPTRSKGYFFDSHTKDRTRWYALHWNSEESPIVSKEFVERMESKYGRESNMFRIRVLGDFPLSDSDSLIPYDWVLDAVNREIEVLKGTYKVKGIDIGLGGDKSVICTRIGPKVTEYEQFDSPDTTQVTGWILRELGDDDDFDFAFIDPLGIGAGVEGRIRELSNDTRFRFLKKVVPVDVKRASSDTRYFRLRDQLYFRVRDAFERGTITIPDDEELIGELTTIKWDAPDSTGNLKIESKKDMRKRGLHSPNKADALALTFFYGDDTYKAVGKDLGPKKKQSTYTWRTA